MYENADWITSSWTKNNLIHCIKSNQPRYILNDLKGNFHLQGNFTLMYHKLKIAKHKWKLQDSTDKQY